METIRKRKKNSIKKRWVLSVLLSVVLSVSQLLPSGVLAADPSPKPSMVPKEGWENYNHFNFAEALQKSIYFYDAEKCGPGITGGRLEWRGDCHVGDQKIPLTNTSLSKAFIEKYKDILDPDGDGAVDVHGGYHDAGDHVRFGLPQGYAAGTLGWGFYEFRDSFKKIGEEEHMIDILKGFSDTFLRCTFMDENGKVIAFCYMVGEGIEDHTFWGPPELYPKTIARPADFATAETPGSDVCASTAASLAISYLNFKDQEPEYAEKCLTVAKAMHEFAKENRGLALGDGFYTSSYDEDELSWSATWLYICTGDINYIREIDSATEDGLYTGYLKRIVRDNNNNTWQNIWAHSWDVVWGGTFMKLASIFPDYERFQYFARWNVEYMTGGKIKHLDPNDQTYIATSPAGYSMINGWGSARYNTAIQLCALVYEKYNPERTDFGDWAKSQMEYLMGRNPMGYSYIVGYGYEEGLPFARHVHHRAAHGSKTQNMNDPPEHRHILWGALAGGPDLNDFHIDETTDFVYNEVAVDYNAAFVGACAGLYKFYGEKLGHKKIENFPPLEEKFDPYYAEARVEQENKERTQVTIKLHNESSQPPHFEKGMKARYYFNINEMLEAGQTIEDVKFDVCYDEQVSLQEKEVEAKGPIKWDDTGTYYYEFDWSGNDIYGDREYQFALIAKQDPNYQSHWIPDNDWSRKGLTEEYAVTRNIPVYLDGVKVYGEEPPVASPTPVPTVNPSASPSNNASIIVEYKCGEDKATSNTIRPTINIKNTGTSPIKLSDIKVRYWYTNEGGAQTFTCDYAPFGADKITGTFVNISNPVDNASIYCEIGFTDDAGTLSAGASTGSLPIRFEGNASYNQSNDYSFDPKMTGGFGDNTKITAYVKGALKYGVEPVKIIETPPPGYKISGYVSPDFSILPQNAAAVLKGFKVELLGTGMSTTTDEDGYFEITGIPNETTSSTVRITKENYLRRDIKDVVLSGNAQIGTKSSPIAIWAGDMVINNIQDDAINISDILEVAKSFNSSKSDAKYIESSDFNKDGAININDIMIVVTHFNKGSQNYQPL